MVSINVKETILKVMTVLLILSVNFVLLICDQSLRECNYFNRNYSPRNAAFSFAPNSM
jgi:hypothetical protein